MRTMLRNKRAVWYKLLVDSTEGRDEHGYRSGESTPVYSRAHKLLCNVSPARGVAQIELFGENENYNKVIVVDDMNCPVTESTIFYVDKPPEGAHDYIVEQIARSANSISIALKKVNVHA